MRYYVSKNTNFGHYFQAIDNRHAIAYAIGYMDAKGWSNVKHWRVYNCSTHRGVYSENTQLRRYN